MIAQYAGDTDVMPKLHVRMEDDNVSPIEHLGPFYDEICYPYHIMSEIGLFRLDFKPLTILYGRNGSPQKYEISKIATAPTSNDIFHWMLDLRLKNDRKLQK